MLSLWAGVERIVGNATLTQPLCRMVDTGLTEGMVEWVVGHTLRHHLGMDRHIVNPAHVWDPTCPPLARERPVAMLGMGALGTACARALTALNFPVTGWSRTAKDIPGIPTTTDLRGSPFTRRADRRHPAAQDARDREHPERRNPVLAAARCGDPEPRPRPPDRR